MALTAKIEGQNLHLIIPMLEAAPSSTGKTMIIAKNSWEPTTATMPGGQVISVNVLGFYKP